MTYSSPRAWLTGCAVAASSFLLASCTSGSGDDTNANSSSSPAPSVSQTATGSSEKKLTEQAQAALAAVHSGTMVEAGAERVTDGIHTEPNLSEGKTYRLNLVCFGSGNAQLAFTPGSAGAKTTVPCDQSVVQQRITANKPIRIDVDGTKGSTGMIAWQIDAI
ncbi:hypothetical protein O3Q52_15190 [Streptomyces sp. ActVer]|uniref:hypothetical protein n=1 Tax=Streptomyces sp. ActVer TaxID=3014558 RepID=UPI0022B3EAD2|nr:hypothetical protein [Streptomyces sp. ActVer]MCZ4509519.1 hypothetical protein [Streptomyces sp. ActVer]